MQTRHHVVSGFLTAGVSVAQQPSGADIDRFTARLRPLVTQHRLIRVGPDSDGGYLVPDDLDGIAACFSPGVSDWAPFEEQLIARGIPCFMADASVDGAPIKGASFLKKFVGVINDDQTIRLDDWVRQLGPSSGDLLLQMDIEGAEWPVLLNVSDETLRRFRIIVIELHDLEQIMDRHALRIMQATMDRLAQDFLVVHSHPNNHGGVVRKGRRPIPRVIEITLLRRDRCQALRRAVSLPHPLDRPNAPEKRDVKLPVGWIVG